MKTFKYKLKEFNVMDKNLILKYALQNAIKFGKANAGAVIGKVISENPDTKNNMKELAKEVNCIIEEISKLSNKEQLEKLKEIAPELLEKKEHEERIELKELEDVPKKKVIMRFAPSPSGPMHIGHAITGGLTSAYVKKYGGKFILRIEDTNSDNIYPPAYEMLPKEAEWIFGNVSEVWIQSDRMKIYYDYLTNLIKLNAVYVCTCSQEKFKEYSEKMEDCPCRNLSIEENIKRWENMFDKNKGYKEGEAVVRFKSSMQDKNPAMRDFPLARINDSEHPRQGFKYRVWPLMNLCVTVDDIEAGMTHIIRAKDHVDNAKRQEKIFNVLKKPFPKTYFVGRYNFKDLELSCSKTKERIEKGEFSGWDDIRLPFLAALRRRGYQPEAFMKYTKLVGLSPVDKTISAEEFFKIIDAFNKEIIDKTSKRFFFVHDYEKIKIKNAPKQKLKLRMHPTVDLGFRELEVNDQFYIQKDDLKDLKENELYRLMDCLNFTKKGKEFVFDSLEHEKFKNKGKKIMHFLPADNNIEIEILMNDATVLKGLAENNIQNLKVGEIIQFERFGFCRLDKIQNKKYYFWFTHK